MADQLPSRPGLGLCGTGRPSTVPGTPLTCVVGPVIAADRPRSRPFNRYPSPACHRSQTSTRSSSVNLTTTTSSMRHHSHRQVLHYPQRPQPLCAARPRPNSSPFDWSRCTVAGPTRIKGSSMQNSQSAHVHVFVNDRPGAVAWLKNRVGLDTGH